MSDAALDDKDPGSMTGSPAPVANDVGSFDDRRSNIGDGGADGQRSDGEDFEGLTAEFDRVKTQLLGAIDSVMGAEAERAAAESRIRELEHQHHMLEVERDELRREVDRLTWDREKRSLRRWVTGRARSLLRRLGVG